MCSTQAPLPRLDFTEALKDSPRFRQTIGIHQLYFEKLEGRLNELMRLLNCMEEFGKNYTNSLYTLSVMMNQLCADSLPQDSGSQATLKSLSNAYAHIVHLHKNFIDQSYMVVANNVNSILRNELSKLAETRSQFDSLSNSLDEALVRKAAVIRSRASELADARNALTAVGTCFAHTALDYVAQLNIAREHKDHLVVDAFWAFIKECSSFFSRGHAFFDEWTVIENGSVSDAVSALSAKSKSMEKKMQDRHSLVPKEVFMHPTGISPEEDVVMEGYLFKRATNAFKTWHRRWFQITDNKLLYSHRSSEAETPKVMELDLKLCLVRPAPASIERACCFELVTPVKNHLLQADSETLCNAWMRALQRTILHLHESDDGVPTQRSTMGGTTDDFAKKPQAVSIQDTLLVELRRIPGNDRCADCGDDSPKWASINLGILLCIQCCGIHRSFGVQVSKVRSLTMDAIEAEQRKLMLALGNQLVNSIYLSHLPEEGVVPPRPRASSSRPVREAWIKAKYIERRFARKSSERARSSAQMRAEGIAHKISSNARAPLRSSSDQDLAGKQASRCPSEPFSVSGQHLAEDATTEWKSTPLLKHSSGELLRIAACGSDTDLTGSHEMLVDVPESGNRLHEAAEAGDVAAMCRIVAEGVDVNATYAGTTALHTAVKANKGVAAEFLLLNGAKINSLDAYLNSPLHIAASKGYTLIVCQLMKRGVDQRLRNHRGESALDLAVDGKHADIVTLLRLQDMRDEFSEEFNNPMDEAVDDVIQDISRRVGNAQ